MRLNLGKAAPGKSVVDTKPLPAPAKVGGDPARQILEQSGVITRSNGEAPEISKILDMKGLSRDEIAGRLKDLAFFSELENVRLQATKLALELHGDLRRDVENRVPNLTFVLQQFTDGGVPQSLDAILTPRDITNV